MVPVMDASFCAESAISGISGYGWPAPTGLGVDQPALETEFGSFLERCLSDLETPSPAGAPAPPVDVRQHTPIPDKHPSDLLIPIAVPIQPAPPLLPLVAQIQAVASMESEAAASPDPATVPAAGEPTDLDAKAAVNMHAIPELAFQVRLVSGGPSAPSKPPDSPPSLAGQARAPDPPSPETAQPPAAPTIAADTTRATVVPASVQAPLPIPEPLSRSVPEVRYVAHGYDVPSTIVRQTNAPSEIPSSAPSQDPKTFPSGAILPHVHTQEEPAAPARRPDPAAPAGATKPVSSAKSAGSSGDRPDSGQDNPAPAPPVEANASNAAAVPLLSATAPPISEHAPPVPVAPSASEANPATRAEPQPEPPSAPVSHDVAWHLNDGQNNVDVRMAERGGEIRVTVQTTDHELASSLRTDLPDLVGKLRQSGFQAEAWHPGSSPSDGSRRNGAENRGSQQDAPGGRRDGRPRHNQQQPKNPSRWAGEWQRLDPAQESSI